MAQNCRTLAQYGYSDMDRDVFESQDNQSNLNFQNLA